MTESDADRFAAAYAALREREEWAERGRARRVAALDEAVAMIRARVGANALIVDIGAGARRRPGVIGIDLTPRANVRGDMRALPLRNASVDGAVYAASLHYAPLDIAVAEAARVVRPGGMLVAIDSPIYAGTVAARRAKDRTAAYYARAGFPELASHYHPIEVGALRSALEANGFEVMRLHTGSRWRRLLRRGPSSVAVARKLR